MGWSAETDRQEAPELGRRSRVRFAQNAEKCGQAQAVNVQKVNKARKNAGLRQIQHPHRQRKI